MTGTRLLVITEFELESKQPLEIMPIVAANFVLIPRTSVKLVFVWPE